MPVFGIPQSGPFAPPNQGLNLTAINPSESFTFLDGTETLALNYTSVACVRGFQGSTDAGSTFNITGMPSGMTIDVQVCSPPPSGFASTAAMDAAFTTVVTMVPDANGNAAYTDVGRSIFWRLKVSAYSAPSSPVIATINR